MRLFHGSNTLITSIDLSLSKPNKDFGKAFYLSEDREQALDMAKFKADLLGGEAVVTEFCIDTLDGLKVVPILSSTIETNRLESRSMTMTWYMVPSQTTVLGPRLQD